MGHKRSV
ncbi:hypothetical protein R3I94_018293 [Phoxinus phoxinus]